jgi:hypothetical protein
LIFHIPSYSQYHADEYNTATSEDIPANNDTIPKNQAHLFALGGTGLQQYHANDYNAATGEYIPAENEAMAMAMAMAKNKKHLLALGKTCQQHRRR